LSTWKPIALQARATGLDQQAQVGVDATGALSLDE
jgi:hypothetical protein